MRDGILRAISSGYIEREIARSAYEYQRRIESGRQVIVGLNQYQSDTRQKLELFQFDPEEEEEWQRARLAEARSTRSTAEVRNALSTLKQAARDDANLVPATLDAVQSMATEGEILDTLREVYGEYVDPGVF
jgi:methylmalonyl-CoA mutase N-terminal domain/subunit